jgi:hypothetical protein
VRANIPHTIRERRPLRKRRGRRAAGTPQAVTSAPGSSDRAVQRARDAGGPVDHASYNCECGYVFVAPVSTTVKCPHCDSGQAW